MRGMTVQLVEQTTEGYDAFGAPIVVSEQLVDIDDVLVGQPSADDAAETYSLYGKTCAFVLGIPKTDEHDWTDREVIIFGDRYRTIGFPMRGIDANIPLRWNRNVKVERFYG